MIIYNMIEVEMTAVTIGDIPNILHQNNTDVKWQTFHRNNVPLLNPWLRWYYDFIGWYETGGVIWYTEINSPGRCNLFL